MFQDAKIVHQTVPVLFVKTTGSKPQHHPLPPITLLRPACRAAPTVKVVLTIPHLKLSTALNVNQVFTLLMEANLASSIALAQLANGSTTLLLLVNLALQNALNAIKVQEMGL